jgi:drug/metabolite transporter (DMT)-like permease
MNHLKGYIFIMTAAAFWGISATAAKSLLNQQVETLLIVQTRVSFSCLLMLAFFALFNRLPLRLRLNDIWRFALLGILGVAGAHFTYYFTIKESTVATGILIQYTAPMLVMVYGAMTKEESVTVVKIIAALVSLAGCVLAVGGYDASVLKITPIGLVSGVGSVVCFSFMNIFVRHLFVRYSVWTVTFYSILFASVFWFVVNPPWNVASAEIPFDIWKVLVLLAVISVLIPHTMYFAGLRHIVPSRAIITSALEPVVAIISASLLLGEHLQSVQVAGAVLVIASIVLLQMRRESNVLHSDVLSVSYTGKPAQEHTHAP